LISGRTTPGVKPKGKKLPGKDLGGAPRRRDWLSIRGRPRSSVQKLQSRASSLKGRKKNHFLQTPFPSRTDEGKAAWFAAKGKKQREHEKKRDNHAQGVDTGPLRRAKNTYEKQGGSPTRFKEKQTKRSRRVSQKNTVKGDPPASPGDLAIISYRQ